MLGPILFRQLKQSKMEFYRCKVKGCIYKVRKQEFLDYHMKMYHGKSNYKWCFFCGFCTKVQVCHLEFLELFDRPSETTANQLLPSHRLRLPNTFVLSTEPSINAIQITGTPKRTRTTKSLKTKRTLIQAATR